MVVPFDRFESDQEIAEDYRRFDKLIGDLCDVLFHVLTSGRASAAAERFQEPQNDPNFTARGAVQRAGGARLNGRSADRNGLNEMCPDLLSNIYGHSKRAVLGNPMQAPRR